MILTVLLIFVYESQTYYLNNTIDTNGKNN